MARTIIIGDIHGCYDELMDLLDKVGTTGDDLVLSVGDLVDRGPKPDEVVDLFRSRPNSLVLMGNHERKHVRGILSYSQQVARLQMGERYLEHVRWMAGLPYFYETDDVRVVHWGLFPGVPLSEVPEDVLAGTASGDARLRERLGDRPWYELYEDDKPVAFGHSVVGEQPLVLRDRVFGLDTGACHGMRLTALVMPDRRLVSVPAREDHWARVREDWQLPVLQEHPWASMTFEQLQKKVRKLRDPELTGDYLDRVLGWVEAVRGAIPTLAAALDSEVERLQAEVGAEGFGKAAAALPASRWLIAHARGRLSRESLGCSSAADVFALADALGVLLPVSREPAGGG